MFMRVGSLAARKNKSIKNLKQLKKTVASISKIYFDSVES